MRTIIAVLMAAGLLSAVTSGQGNNGFDVSWNTISGGGVMRSTGGNLELSGTIGQPAAGRASGGGLEVTGGFWFEIERADCNGDGAITLLDVADFAACLSGPVIPDGVSSQCACFDLDGDQAIDLSDFAELQNDLSSP